MSATAGRSAASPLPCPFCGGPAEARLLDDPRAGVVDAFVVSCVGDCGVDLGPHGFDGDEASAVEVWNRRATATAMTKAEAEALVGTFWRAVVEDERERRRGLPVDGLRSPYDYLASHRAAAAIVAALTGCAGGAE